MVNSLPSSSTNLTSLNTEYFMWSTCPSTYRISLSSFTKNGLEDYSAIRFTAIQISPTNDLEARTLTPRDHIHNFKRQAISLDFSVRHEYQHPDVFLGLSIQVNGNETDGEVASQLRDIYGVVSVSSVYNVTLPVQPGLFSEAESSLPDSNRKLAIAAKAAGTANLASSLQMGGVDILHQAGIKGKGIKIGIIDTGIDYRHPALGAGFGPGFKVAGGYSFVSDAGMLVNGPDPLATCYKDGHGTHVAGIIGMEPVPGGFDITGVAPEASLYAYRVFDCSGSAGSDTILAAMLKAYDDGVDMVSMSLSVGAASFSGAVNPLAAVTKVLTDNGIAVIVAQSNSAGWSPNYSPQLYTQLWPGTEPSAISVGSAANTLFPLVYSATDSLGAEFQYASMNPLYFPNGTDVFIVNDGCFSDNWMAALAQVDNINETIFAYEVSSSCRPIEVGNWNSAPAPPTYIMALNTDTTNPYESEYQSPSPGIFGSTNFINMNSVDARNFLENFAASGGYQKYKVLFNNPNFTSTKQDSGGMVDYYSSFGPTWHEYDLKPQISAPGGHILSTWPLGFGGYAILSGTSMATPYLAGCYALVKSQFPDETIQQIRNRLQITAKPMPWMYDRAMLSATPQQGAGLVNVFDAIYSETTVSPGQLTLFTSKTAYDTANVTIENNSENPKTYTLSHEGAGYMDYRLDYKERNQLPLYGNATFSSPTITLQPHHATTVLATISPPNGVEPSKLPVFGGFIEITSSDEESYSIPYVGPPYSLFHTPYIYTDGTSSPAIYTYNGSTIEYAGNLVEIDVSGRWGSSISNLQWTQRVRIDLLPANTSIMADHYGFDRGFEWEYRPSSAAPTEKVFGFESFGTLVNKQGYFWPGGEGVSGSGTTVLTSAGKVAVGQGDYRWFVGVLRWGGAVGQKEDYDTWLGPVMRFTNGTISG
ncbi:subtilisin-like protein [Cadophora sp. DSE1049]|nr:subtilisin-like protein [Cadophora sp. DSE1049]